MATILHKKFVKNRASKEPETREPCEHEAFSTNNSELLADNNISIHGTSDIGLEDLAQDKPLQKTSESERKAATRYRWRLIIGLFFPFVVQSLDTTIISGALPFIASDFHQLPQLNWIVSAFNLTCATFIPFWGQFADIFGRYAALQSALLSVLLGSTLCSAAPVTAFPMLLVGRGFQGLGCAGLLIITKVVLADKVSLKENARNNTSFTLVAGVGYGIGPVVGGYLTQVSWRWCFIINIPLGVIGLVLVHFVLRPVLLGPQEITSTDPNANADAPLPQTFAARINTIDFCGQFLFLFGMGLLILALTWAGSSYPWTSVKILAPLITGVVLLIAFGFWEYNLRPTQFLAKRSPTRKPMIALQLLWTRNAGLLVYINLVTGMAMYAVFYFVDLYFVLVRSTEAGEAGKQLLYYTPGLAVGAYLAIIACNSWPLQTFFPILLGTSLEPLGITLLAIAIQSNNLPFLYGMLALTGVGTGVRLMPGTLHGIAYFPNQIASIVSLMSLAMSLGGTLATTIMLNIFNNHLNSSGLSFDSTSSSSFGAINSLPAGQRAFFREKAMKGLALAFFAITAFMWLGVLCVAGLGNVRIGKKGTKDEIVERGSFLGYLLGGKRVEKA